jgi:hypothetical protein
VFVSIRALLNGPCNSGVNPACVFTHKIGRLAPRPDSGAISVATEIPRSSKPNMHENMLIRSIQRRGVRIRVQIRVSNPLDTASTRFNVPSMGKPVIQWSVDPLGGFQSRLRLQNSNSSTSKTPLSCFFPECVCWPSGELTDGYPLLVFLATYHSVALMVEHGPNVACLKMWCLLIVFVSIRALLNCPCNFRSQSGHRVRRVNAHK